MRIISTLKQKMGELVVQNVKLIKNDVEFEIDANEFELMMSTLNGNQGVIDIFDEPHDYHPETSIRHSHDSNNEITKSYLITT